MIGPLVSIIVPGSTFTGTYIKIGVNPGGTFGVGNVTYGIGTGFQYPIGTAYESLAYAWWGEGYAIAYRYTDGVSWYSKVAYWQPGYGWPPPATTGIRLIGAYISRNDAIKAIYVAKVQTLDQVLNVTFTFTFPKDQKYVILKTDIKNTGLYGTVKDVIYKRLVDWDVHSWTSYNYWTNDATGAYASYNDTAAKKYWTMSVSGHPITSTVSLAYIDLYAWDDETIRGPGAYSIQSGGRMLYGDGMATLCYDFYDMGSGTTKTAETTYQAGYNSYYWP
jgi:hypothetical protein